MIIIVLVSVIVNYYIPVIPHNGMVHVLVIYIVRHKLKIMGIHPQAAIAKQNRLP